MVAVSTQKQKKTEKYQDGSFLKLWSDYKHFGFISAWEYITSLVIFFYVYKNKFSFLLISPTISLFLVCFFSFCTLNLPFDSCLSLI